MNSAVYTLDDVVDGPEERLFAHLDGLVLGGQPVAEALLIPALDGADPARTAAAVWALLQAEDWDHRGLLLRSLAAAAEPPARAAIARALALGSKMDWSRLLALWEPGAAAVRAIVLDLLRARNPGWARGHIGPALRSGEPVLVAAGLRALRHLPDPTWLADVEETLRAEDAEVAAEAMMTGIALKSKQAWNACRHAVEVTGEACRLPLALLATSEDPTDRVRVRQKLGVPDVRRHAVWALGFAGDVESVDALVDALTDEASARVAGESISAITGIAIAGPLVKPGESKSQNDDEVGDDDPPPIVRSEDFLRQPEPQAVRAWWDRERLNFRAGLRYVHGQPRADKTLRVALNEATTWRRSVLSLELANAGLGAPPELTGWAREQRQR